MEDVLKIVTELGINGKKASEIMGISYGYYRLCKCKGKFSESQINNLKQYYERVNQ